MTELARRIKEAEAKVKSLVEGYVPDDEEEEHQQREATTSAADEEAVEQANLDSDDEDDDSVKSADEIEEQFRELEEEVATLVADVHDLALYTKLNFTGFMKIVKVRRRLRAFNLPLSDLTSPPFARNTTYVLLPNRLLHLLYLPNASAIHRNKPPSHSNRHSSKNTSRNGLSTRCRTTR